MSQGTILEDFSNSGSNIKGPSANLDGYNQPQRQGVVPKKGFIANINKGIPLDDPRIKRTLFVTSDDSNLIDQYISYADPLSLGVKAKAQQFGVTHIVGKHRFESNFGGGMPNLVAGLQPSEILAYHGFIQSLNPSEQNEYSNFLGINFDKIGHAIGSAAKSVGHAVGGAATAVAHTARDIGVGAAHVVRSVGVGAAHVARGVGIGTAHVIRDVQAPLVKSVVAVGKFTWKNLPYIAAAAAAAMGQPEISAALLGVMAAMKNQGLSDAQIAAQLAAQGYPTSIGDPTGAGSYPGDDSDPNSLDMNIDPDDLDLTPDADGNIHFADGSVFNTNTNQLTTPDGQTKTAELPDFAEKKTNWLMWAAIAAVVLLIGIWLYHNKKLNFKWLKHKK